MADCVDYACLVTVLRTAAEKIKAQRAELSQLDAATGDGDHGTAMAKVAEAIATTLAHDASREMKTLLKDIGWAVLSTDAGSTSPLYGSFFLGMSEGVAGATLDAPAFVAMLAAGVAKLRKNTKAEVGHKTMIDALVPALAALQAAADAGQSLAQALAAGATAAVQGAEATQALQAAFGRARNIGARSIGHKDPGAVSMSLLLVGIKEGYVHGGCSR